jgi:trans-AT polyketide synthase/acyltransferase/oxidoreductase domain-containing protein
VKAAVFPGQGAQRKGMGVDLFERYPRLLEQADAVLGYSLFDLCTDGADRLIDTRYTQPALFVTGYLGYLDHEHRHGAPAMLAGHSIGEFVALAAAGALDFIDALRLVDRRARIMAAIRDGAMAAVIGPGRDEVDALITRLGVDGLEIANENSPTQTIVAGLSGEIDAFVERCREAGTRAVRLRVSGAFHSRHMRPAAAEFAQALRETPFQPPRIPVIANVTARPHDAQIADVMAAHLYSPVRWMQSVQAMLDAGVTEFVEIGPAPVLAPMIEEIRSTWTPPVVTAPVVVTHWPEFAPPPVTGPHATLAASLHALYRQPAPRVADWAALWPQGQGLAGWPPLRPVAAPRALRRQIRLAIEALIPAAASAQHAHPPSHLHGRHP